MNKLIRYGVGAPLAGVVTLGLTISMAAMIATEFKVQDKLEDLDFAINVTPPELPPVIPRTEMEPLKQVEVPPPPPETGVDLVDRVKVPVVTVPGKKLVFNPDVTLCAGPVMTIMDSNPQPILRHPPIMPSRADRSGHCNVRFNVSAEGAPYDIQITSCTQSLFEGATLKSVAKWKYRPRIQNGQAVAMQGVTNRVSYNLTDERGEIIPE